MSNPPGGPDEPDESVWAPRPGRRDAPTSPSDTAVPAGYVDAVVVARGGDSVVYRAHQRSVGREVAIKVVDLGGRNTGEDVERDAAVARFRRELEITVRLGRQHPNIMTVLAVDETAAGQPCLVMDYCELGSLHDRLLARGPLPVSEVVAAGTVVADALGFAHGQGVLHRDVKPQNVLVLPTSWVLADFGLARAIDAGHSASLERFSYRHASPQVLDGEAPTVADDVWSLGSTLFTLLDGRAPFAADDPDEDSALSYLRRARTETPRPLDRDDVPDALRAVVARCLARERADRFASAGDLRDALADVPTETRSWAPAGTVVPEPEKERSESERSESERSEPQRPEPDPVAVSALEHLPGPASARDAGETGVRPDEVVSEPVGAGDDPPSWSRRRWVVLAAVVVLALAVGGVVGFFRGGDDPQARPSPTPSSTSGRTSDAVVVVPSLTTSPVGPSASPSIDPSLAPRITLLDRRGDGRVDLRWTDPTGGRSDFVVNFTGDGSTPIYRVSMGRTRLVLKRFPSGRQCLRVTSYGFRGGRVVVGISPPRCLG